MKEIFPSLLKHLASEVLKGTHIFNISMPVQIFGKDSFLTLVASA
jgi:hypothetical protein